MSRIFFQRASSGFRTVRGELIKKVQRTLINEGLDIGILDGIYGDKTERGLIAYQQQYNLAVSGKIDEETWTKTVSAEPPPVLDRCLQLTADFEGHGFGKAAGNFDGAGITWGIIGFTLRYGELQKILSEIKQEHEDIIPQAFGPLTDNLLTVLDLPLSQQMQWAEDISIGLNRYRIENDWEAAFKRLGDYSEVQAIQLKRVQKYWDIALRDVARFDLASEQGLALCFDIAVQNGGIDSEDEETRIRSKTAESPPTTEQDVRVIIANVVAENSNPRYIEDVRSRKLTIAVGQGIVHGAKYLTKTWGIDDVSWQ